MTGSPLTPKFSTDLSPDRLLGSNLAAIAACDLELSRRVAAARPDSLKEGVLVEEAQSGVATLRASGMQIHSAYDPIAEAQILCKQVPEQAERVMAIGFGLGHHLVELLCRPALRRLDVVPVSASVLRGVAGQVDLKPLLCDPRVRFVPEEEPRLGLPFVAIPPLLKIADPKLGTLCAEALDHLAIAQIQGRLPARGGGAEGGEEGLDAAFQSLAMRHKGACALLVDAGPSLDSSLPMLSQIAASPSSRVVIFACEGALPSLTAQRITPTYVLSVDSHLDRSKEGPRPAQGGGANTPLIHDPQIHPAILSQHRGPKICAPPIVIADGVTTSAASLLLGAVCAKHVGAAGLVLVGADLGYPASGIQDPGARPWFRKVPSLGGGQIAASAWQIAIRHCLEHFIKDNKGIAAYQTSPIGARIRGASEVSLGDALGHLRCK